ncbi:uncharacterized protein L199_003541 [Kwoniella botswanensis]|uniref:uncharacterized protein n=1 Tax=Kwoniella botswanensis TaxID=1268659 RepID=UPI00315D87DA
MSSETPSTLPTHQDSLSLSSCLTKYKVTIQDPQSRSSALTRISQHSDRQSNMDFLRSTRDKGGNLIRYLWLSDASDLGPLELVEVDGPRPENRPMIRNGRNQIDLQIPFDFQEEFDGIEMSGFTNSIKSSNVLNDWKDKSEFQLTMTNDSELHNGDSFVSADVIDEVVVPELTLDCYMGESKVKSLDGLVGSLRGRTIIYGKEPGQQDESTDDPASTIINEEHIRVGNPDGVSNKIDTFESQVVKVASTSVEIGNGDGIRLVIAKMSLEDDDTASFRVEAGNADGIKRDI